MRMVATSSVVVFAGVCRSMNVLLARASPGFVAALRARHGGELLLHHLPHLCKSLHSLPRVVDTLGVVFAPAMRETGWCFTSCHTRANGCSLPRLHDDARQAYRPINNCRRSLLEPARCTESPHTLCHCQRSHSVAGTIVERRPASRIACCGLCVSLDRFVGVEA